MQTDRCVLGKREEKKMGEEGCALLQN